MEWRGVSVDLDIRSIRLVLFVARHRSFTSAAEAAHLSQSALSRAVRNTEHCLGVRLFDRTTRSVEPTPAGHEFVRIGSRLLDEYQRGMREFGLFRDGLGGVVRVASLPSVAATLLPAVVARLKGDAPNVVLEIHDMLAHEAVAALLMGHVDIAITNEDFREDRVTYRPLLVDRFRVVHSRAHPFSDVDSVSWLALANEPMVVFNSGSSLRAMTDETFEALGARPNAVVEAPSILVAAGLVATGLGVAAVPGTVFPLMSFADLAFTRLVSPEVERTLAIARLSSRPASASTARVVATLLGVAESATTAAADGRRSWCSPG